jgi:hypothetical protein
MTRGLSGSRCGVESIESKSKVQRQQIKSCDLLDNKTAVLFILKNNVETYHGLRICLMNKNV